MRENKIEEVKPMFPMKPPEPKKKKQPPPGEGEVGEGKASKAAAEEAPTVKPAEGEIKPSEKTLH
jgi:hypothetical protein